MKGYIKLATAGLVGSGWGPRKDLFEGEFLSLSSRFLAQVGDDAVET